MASQKDVAAHLDMTERQVRELVARDVLRPPADGRGYDLAECRERYLLYLRGVVAGREGRRAGA